MSTECVISHDCPAIPSFECKAKSSDNLIHSQKVIKTDKVYVIASGNILTPKYNVNY